MFQTKFTSVFNGNTLNIVADNATVASLTQSINANCSYQGHTTTGPLIFNGSVSDPRPEEAIQYYRASSAVLTMEGYNNTVALSNEPNGMAVPLPSNVDWSMLDCFNSTIGRAVPLFSGGEGPLTVPSGLVLLGTMIVYFLA